MKMTESGSVSVTHSVVLVGEKSGKTNEKEQRPERNGYHISRYSYRHLQSGCEKKKRIEKRGPHCVYVYVVERNGKKTSPNAGGSYLPNTLGMSAGRIYK